MNHSDLTNHTNKPVPIFNRPAALGILAFIILAGLFAILIYQRFLIVQEAKKKEAYDVVNTAKDKLQELLAYSSSATKILSFFIDNNGDVKNFDSVAAQIISVTEDIDALELVPGGVIKYVFPLKGNEAALGFDILADSTRNKEAFKAIEKKELFFSGPFQLKQGGMGIVGRLPVFRNKKFWGFSAVIIKLSTLLKAAGIDSVDQNGNYFQLSKINPDTKEEEFFILHDKEPYKNYATSVDVPNGEWKLSVQPPAGYKKLADIFILALLGFLISVFGAVFVFSISGRPQQLNNLVKERTAQLKESEEKFSRAFHSNVLGFAIYDEDFRIVDINGPYAAVLEKPRHELIGKTSDEAGLISKINIAKRESISNEIEVILNVDGQLSNYETEIETNDGQLVTVLLSIEPLDLHGKKHWLTSLNDITAKKKAELLLKESEEKYRTLVEQASDGIFIADHEGRFLIVNSSGYNMSQYSREELSKLTIYDLVSPEDIKQNPFHFSEMKDNKVATAERRMKRKDGTFLDVEVTAKFISGNRFLAFVRDVSERRKVEKQLAENEQRLNRAELMGDLGHGYYNIKNGSMHLSEGLYKIFGVIPETFSHTIDGLRSVIHPDDFLIQQEAVETMFKKGEVEVEFRIVRPGGEVRNVLFKTMLSKNDKGELIDSFTTALCVTDRKKAQKELEESFSVLEATLESTADGILVVNSEGRIIHYNKKFSELWNIPTDILAAGDDNKAIDFVLEQLKSPEIFLAKVKELYIRPEAVSFDILEFKDGRVFERYSQPQLIGAQNPGRVWSFRDVTEKFKAKELLEKSYREIRQLASNLQSIREDERTNIAREIHDELGQQLTGLKMDIHWLSRKIKSTDKEINNKMKESIELINATITSVRKIATDLRPSILDDLGLVAALEWQGEEFEKRSGTKVRFINQSGDLTLKPEVATGIFRIYQELLTNIARHANAQMVNASLQIEENILRFSIKDNGAGFNADTIGSKKTLGLLGIKERTLLMGGTYEIKTEPGKGSETIISIPLHRAKATR